MSDAKPTHEQIQRRAYELFLARGSEHGNESQDWFAAEQEFQEASPRDVPPALEALPEQSLRNSVEERRTEPAQTKKKFATSGGSSSS